MELTLIGHDDLYSVEQLQLSLFSVDAQGQAVSSLHRGKTWLTAATAITRGGVTHRGVRRLRCCEETVPLRRRILQQSYYLAALPFLPEAPAWGALSGVRPTKLSTRELLRGKTDAQVKKMLEKAYFVTPQRQELALQCSRSTVRAMEKLAQGDISLYLGIPFCPSRCSYCSFVSRTIGQKQELLEPYLEALCKEIAVTGALLGNSSRKVRTIYMGGGTPTTLSRPQMDRLLDTVARHFDLSRCLEFTVEGGRPDTLDSDKLRAIANHGVDRMSINPQTMSDSVLAACGRRHSQQDIRRVYEYARQAGYDAINMDLIAGLPTDSLAGFQRSLEEVIALDPENITVHTLALKKGADLYEHRQGLSSQEEVARMVEFANGALAQAGYKPYYLYRQKYMSGSFENVGWARDGKDCLYNIYMMEEIHPILSLGAGGMNKVTLPSGRLERFHNPKFPEQYIEMLPQVLQQKEELIQLL